MSAQKNKEIESIDLEKPKEVEAVVEKTEKRSLKDRLVSALGGNYKGNSSRKVQPLTIINNKAIVKGGFYIKDGEPVNAWNEPYIDEQLEEILDALGVN